MNTFEIRVFGDPALKQRARDVTEVNGDLARLVDTMFETMYEASGVGLAAPQVGMRKRIFTYDVGEGPQVMINPLVAETAGEWTFEEGCLSVPGITVDVVRPRQVTISGIDLDGNELVVADDDFLGRVFLHEIDHLDGVLLLDRLEPAQRKQALAELRRHEYANTGAPRAGTDTHPRL